jgi:cytochrome c-type biogenesis protein CcmH
MHVARGSRPIGSRRVVLALLAATVSLVPVIGAAWWQDRSAPAPPRPAPVLGATALEKAETEAPHDIRGRVLALAERLAGEPDNVEGWALLARSWTQLGENEKAEGASRRVAELRAKQPRALSLQAEDLIVAASGMVTPEARSLIAAALAADPGDVRARFYDGLARAQAGAGRDALDVWLKLEAASTEEAPYHAGLQANIVRLAAELGLGEADLAGFRRLTKEGG